MQLRPVDDGFINVLVGNSASRDLSELEVQLVLVQSACTLALEGTTRASASQIAARTIQSYKVEATASFTGQIFSNLGIDSVTTHGKNKFVLDANHLEKMRDDIASRCQKASERLETAIEKFRDLPQKIEELRKTWKETLAIRAKEQELIKLINEDRRNPSRIDYLENEYKNIRVRNERIAEIQKEAKALALKEKKLPALEERTKALETTMAEHEKHVRELAERERQLAGKEQEAVKKEEVLAGRLQKLQQRLGWLELASLTEETDTARKELDSLSRQLGEKRSLLDRMLGRNK